MDNPEQVVPPISEQVVPVIPMQLGINAFEASWLSPDAKERHIAQVKDYFEKLKSSLVE